MKTNAQSLFIIFALSLNAIVMFSQDQIFLINGDEIPAKVLEITTDIVKYKKWDNQDGPVYTNLKSEIFMIKYQNGSKDVFTNSQPNASPKTSDNTSAILGIAKEFMDGQIKDESNGAIKLIEFYKQNGVQKEIYGQIFYTFEYRLIIEIQNNIWKESGDRFLEKDWYWNNFRVLAEKGDVYASTFTNNYTMFSKGTKIELTGSIDYENSDNGWRLSGVSMFSKGYKNSSSRTLQSVNSLPKPPQTDSKSKSEIKNIPDSISAVVIINNYIDALGGLSIIDSVKSLDQMYTSEVQGLAISTRIVIADGKYFMEMATSELDLSKQIFDGEIFEVEQMGKKVKTQENNLLALKESATLFPERYYNTSGYKAELKGIENLNGKQAYKLSVQHPSGTLSTEYYDKDTFLKLKDIQVAKAKGQTTSTTLEYSDYKAVNGVLLPHIVIINGSTANSITMKAINIKVNQPVDSLLFKI